MTTTTTTDGARRASARGRRDRAHAERERAGVGPHHADVQPRPLRTARWHGHRRPRRCHALLEGRTIFPDQRNELIELTHHDDGSVIIEFWLRGTNLGGDQPTGKSFEVRLWAVFAFDDDLMTSERVFTGAPTIDQIEGRVTPDGRPVDPSA